MAAWKRDAASGLVVLVPIMITAWVVYWLYATIAALPLLASVSNPFYRVLLTLLVFVLLVFAIGYLMRTALGSIVEDVIDEVVNRLPGLRVVYNASKMAVETALSGTGELQTPVKLETWNGLRMTAFKTGKTTSDGREVLFLPTSPNITTGYVIEVDPARISETDERVEEALTRILSAGFGESGDAGIAIDVADATGDPTDGDRTDDAENDRSEVEAADDRAESPGDRAGADG